MKTCKTCKHWKLKKWKGEYFIQHENIIRPFDEDTYEPKEMPFEVRSCDHPELLFCERPLDPNGFCVADGSGYLANLITGPDFGCIKYQSL